MDQFELRVRFGSPTQAGKIDGKDYSVAGYFGSVDPVALMGMMIGGESRFVLNNSVLNHSMQDYAAGAVGQKFGEWTMQFQLGPKLQQSPVPRLIINDTPESLNLSPPK